VENYIFFKRLTNPPIILFYGGFTITLNDILDTAIPYTQMQVSDLVIAAIVLILGFIVARILVAVFKRALKHSKMPELAIGFLIQLITALLYVAVLLAVLSSLGVTVGSVILGLSAVIGLILGFGMQDTLTNLSAGIWVAVLEPFKKNDYITVAGQTGRVRDIGLMATELITNDNVYIMIPNKMVWNNSIINMSHLPIRRFELSMTFALQNNSEGTVKAVLDVLKKNPSILQSPEPKIYISAITDSTANLEIKAWANTELFDAVKDAVKEELLKEFEA
jgi:Small-conductance mechanosensitive channel